MTVTAADRVRTGRTTPATRGRRAAGSGLPFAALATVVRSGSFVTSRALHDTVPPVQAAGGSGGPGGRALDLRRQRPLVRDHDRGLRERRLRSRTGAQRGGLDGHDWTAILAMVAAGMGIALVPRVAAARREGVVMRVLADDQPAAMSSRRSDAARRRRRESHGCRARCARSPPVKGTASKSASASAGRCARASVSTCGIRTPSRAWSGRWRSSLCDP
ncbi:hypothetical protein J7E88_24540 [Streptomyces sp. ISL-10]|nr:hypothetical protein [Streptomyces sp. ISL-10]